MNYGGGAGEKGDIYLKKIHFFYRGLILTHTITQASMHLLPFFDTPRMHAGPRVW